MKMFVTKMSKWGIKEQKENNYLFFINFKRKQIEKFIAYLVKKK